jgi:hypothetical protein
MSVIRTRGKEGLLRTMAQLKEKHGVRFEPDSGWSSI